MAGYDLLSMSGGGRVLSVEGGAKRLGGELGEKLDDEKMRVLKDSLLTTQVGKRRRWLTLVAIKMPDSEDNGSMADAGSALVVWHGCSAGGVLQEMLTKHLQLYDIYGETLQQEAAAHALTGEEGHQVRNDAGHVCGSPPLSDDPERNWASNRYYFLSLWSL